MREFPASCYYELLDSEIETYMNFVDDLPLSEYFEAYERFSLELMRGLKDSDCRGGHVLPFYHEHGRPEWEEHHRKRNAIYFMVKHFVRE